MLGENCPPAGAWTGHILLTEGRHRCGDQAGAQTIGLHHLADRAMRNCLQARNYKPERPPMPGKPSTSGFVEYRATSPSLIKSRSIAWTVLRTRGSLGGRKPTNGI